MTGKDNQTQANRANAQLATGPRTEEGKARSSQNARKHGLSSSQLKIEESDREFYDSMEKELRAAIRPHGELENTYFDQALFAQWNLRRARQLEEEYFFEDPRAQNEARLRLLDRYARRHEASFHRAMRELTRLQTERACSKFLPVAELQNEPTPALLANPQRFTEAKEHAGKVLKSIMDESLEKLFPPDPPKPAA